MKKLLIGIVVLVILFTGAVYLFIPKHINVVSAITLPGSVGSVQRVTGFSEYRAKWFPGQAIKESQSNYLFDDCSYRFGTDHSFNSNITISYKNIKVNSLFTLLESGDSLQVNWSFNKESNNNPINRLTDYFQLKHIKQVNEKILNTLQDFCSSKKNIYGFDVSLQKQKDSTLITLKSTLNHYPSVTDIYTNIEKLNRYAMSNNAGRTNAPMLNITPENPGTWSFMVALPIDKELNSSGEIIAKRMFAGGKILITEPITGGFATIDSAMNNLEKFKTDYTYMSPAIPFQSLITDRSKEPDSLKWNTRLYYPVY